MHDPIALAELVAAGIEDGEARAWLANGLRRWMRAGGEVSLQRCLRLPERPAGLRRALRDRWLRAAAATLPAGLTDAQRARTLAEACRRFTARKWPVWSARPTAPAHATPTEVCLHYAAQSGALPTTRQGATKFAKSVTTERATMVPSLTAGSDHADDAPPRAPEPSSAGPEPALLRLQATRRRAGAWAGGA